MPTPLTINLFGPPQILRDGRPVEVTRRKSRALVFYLAAQSGPVPRTRLLGLLWPDADRPAAQQVLRTTLHSLRRTLGDSIDATDTTIALADVDIDVRVLTAAIADPAISDGELAAALERYRGDFLADFELSEVPEFDDWVAAERERYHRMVARGLSTLAQRRLERHDYAASREALARALAIDPLQEALQRESMRVEYLAGDRAAAIRHYEQFSTLLDDQLGVPPMPETRALYDAIVTDTLPTDERQMANGEWRPAVQRSPLNGYGAAQSPLMHAAPRPEIGSLPFVGREAELALLRSLQGGQRLALIEGEAGIGKSQLAEQFIRTSGAIGLVGAAHELEQTLPYHPVLEALRELFWRPEAPGLEQLDLAPVWRAEIARLLPELSGGAVPSQAPDESRVWEAVSQLLQAVARLRPIILFLDDLQWADMATLGLIGYLARRITAVSITLVAATRSIEPRSPLALLVQSLTRDARLVRIPLARLQPAEIRTLATNVSPNHPDPLAEWLEQRGEGNPYITVELVRYAREQHLLGPNGTLIPGAPDGPVVPQTIESLIQSRLAQLSPQARLLLDIGVAAGREFAFEVVARASALPESEVFDALDELRTARVIEPLADGRYFRFDHSLTMEVAYHEVGEPRHRWLHRHVAGAIEQIYARSLDEVAATLALHLAEAGEWEASVRYALRGARHAASLAAWKDAIALYRQVLDALPQREQLQVLMELGEALVHIGDTTAAEVYRRAIELASALGDLAATDAARLALGQTLIQQARFADLIAIVEQVRSLGHPGSVVRAELLWGIALSIEGADLCAAAEHLTTAERLNDPQSSPSIQSNIVFELGNVRAQQGDLEAAIALYREALAYAERDPAAIQQRLLAHNNLGYHLHLLGDPQAEVHVALGLQLAQESGVLSLQPYLHSTNGEIALARGDLDTAEREFREGLALAERINLPERVAGLTANLGLVAKRRGQTALAVHHLTAAQARAEALRMTHMATQIQIWLAPLLPPDQARAALATAHATAEASGRQRLLKEIAQAEREIAGG